MSDSGAVAIELRNGSVTYDRRLDRIGRYDERSKDFQFRTLVELRDAGFPPAPGYEILATATKFRKPRVNRPGPFTLDQGQQGACELASLATGLNASPIRLVPAMTMDSAREHYYEVQRRDPYPGGEYPGADPMAGGTDHLTTLGYAAEQGFIKSYWWCGAGSGTPGDDVVQALQSVGWVHFGIPWYESMFWPEPDGKLVVDPSSGLAGYHALCGHSFRYVKLGTDRSKQEYAVCQQSWGESHGGKFYGRGGHIQIAVKDLEEHLLPQSVWGEAAVPIQ